MTTSLQRLTAISLAAAFIAASCGGSTATDEQESGAAEPTAQTSESNISDGGVRLVAAREGASIQANPPDELVILDVRTPEEFAEGHLEGATMIDFYRDDFADQIAGLDPDVPYLIYCRSGNRSGQTAALMTELGFSDVADVDGGIVSWSEGGLPIVTE